MVLLHGLPMPLHGLQPSIAPPCGFCCQRMGGRGCGEEHLLVRKSPHSLCSPWVAEGCRGGVLSRGKERAGEWGRISFPCDQVMQGRKNHQGGGFFPTQLKVARGRKCWRVGGWHFFQHDSGSHRERDHHYFPLLALHAPSIWGFAAVFPFWQGGRMKNPLLFSLLGLKNFEEQPLPPKFNPTVKKIWLWPCVFL